VRPTKEFSQPSALHIICLHHFASTLAFAPPFPTDPSRSLRSQKAAAACPLQPLRLFIAVPSPSHQHPGNMKRYLGERNQPSHAAATFMPISSISLLIWQPCTTIQPPSSSIRPLCPSIRPSHTPSFLRPSSLPTSPTPLPPPSSLLHGCLGGEGCLQSVRSCIVDG
jgi:hypothetical protein